MSALRWRSAICCAAMLTYALSAAADGGRLLIRQAAGPFLITLFSTPDVLAVGPADLSVLVEQSSGAGVLLDADVSLLLTREGGGAAPVHAQLTHRAATNRLMQAANLSLPAPGRWDAVVVVREQGREATVHAVLTVAPHSSRRGTVWLFAMLPLGVIALVLWLESEKRRVRRTRTNDAAESLADTKLPAAL